MIIPTLLFLVIVPLLGLIVYSLVEDFLPNSSVVQLQVIKFFRNHVLPNLLVTALWLLFVGAMLVLHFKRVISGHITLMGLLPGILLLVWVSMRKHGSTIRKHLIRNTLMSLSHIRSFVYTERIRPACMHRYTQYKQQACLTELKSVCHVLILCLLLNRENIMTAKCFERSNREICMQLNNSDLQY